VHRVQKVFDDLFLFHDRQMCIRQLHSPNHALLIGGEGSQTI
jgi:hypothetical protein